MAPGGSSRRGSRSSNRQVEPAPRRRTRPLRMRASSPGYDSSDDDLPELVLPPAPAPAPVPAPRTRSLRMHASPPDDGRRRYRPRPRRVARAPPPVVQEPEREPPAPQQPAPQQQIIYLLGCPPDVIMARGDGPGGRTVVGFRCKMIMSLPTASGEDAAAISGALIMCTCHGASFTQAEFLLHAGANPDSNITAYPWLGEEIELPPPSTAGGAQL